MESTDIDWLTDTLPKTDGPYPIAGKKDNYFFSYIAYYVCESDSWYKFDPFDPNFKPSENISPYVIAWGKKIITFLK